MDIIGFNNYQIFPDGKIFSKCRKKFLSVNNIDNYGYPTIKLVNDEHKRKNKRIHKILQQYIPNPNNLQVIDHIDGNKLNFNLNNLRWCNQIDNSNYNNRKLSSANTSGHSAINYNNRKKRWMFNMTYYEKRYIKQFVYKKDALCYKFIFLLRLKSKVL
tara:strand:+ start:52 stop:528 length:477 start_codon:yes stop_codon:yes gene_type:complete